MIGREEEKIRRTHENAEKVINKARLVVLIILVAIVLFMVLVFRFCNNH
jgi:CHASE3 domain sensor protein